MFIRKNVNKIPSNAVAQWHKTEMRKRETSRRSYYIPRIKEGISVALENSPKNMHHGSTNLN